MSWAAAIGVAGQIATSLIDNHFRRRNAAEANNWAKEAASIDRNWQERMSNTAHQREVADLKAAGLNPILSAGGSGASSGGGSTADTAQAESPDLENPIASALEAKMMTQQMKLLKAQEEQSSTAADYNNALKRKTNKEADILGPKSTIFQKLDEQLRSVPEKINQWKKEIKMSDPKAPNTIWRKP